MNDDRHALLERFRAGLLERVHRVEALLDELDGTEAAEEPRRNALGELHTLKGEARMLGLRELTELTHALESRIEREPAGPAILQALDAMRRALAGDLDPVLADAVLEAALVELGEPETDGEDASARKGNGQPAAPRADSERARSAQRRFVQVDAAVLDALCERMAELSIEFGKLRARSERFLGGLGARQRLDVLEDFARCDTLVSDSTTRAWALRLVSVEPMLRELRRHARSLAAAAGKELTVSIEARGVKLERDVLDQLWDSLLHLVQNAVDHGIESGAERGEKPASGSLLLAARSVGSSVVLTVEDDGRGIDPAALREAARKSGKLGAALSLTDREVLELVFDDGFSTKSEVSTLSGRGVGLAVVRRQIEAMGGRVGIESTPGAGTRFSLNVPFTMTKERCVVVEVGTSLFGFAARSVLAVVDASEHVQSADGRRTLRYQDEALPLVSLAAALGLDGDGGEACAVVFELGGALYGLGVSRIVGDHELIRRPADSLLGSLTGVTATAQLDDGRMVLLLHPTFVHDALDRAGTAAPRRAAPSVAQRARRVLVVDDSPVVCQVVKEVLVSAGLSVEIARDGNEALALLARREPDLVLSDVEMPNLGGFDLLAEIRRRNQKLPFVLLTTRGSVEDRQRATELGANAYVLKTGFKGDALLDIVQRFLPRDERAARRVEMP